MKGIMNRMENRKRYLITGAAGFIGFHISKYLLKLGYEIIGYDNLNDYYDVGLKQLRLKELNKNSKFEFYKNDLKEYEVLSKLAKTYQFDGIIHLAAQAGVRYSEINPRSYIETNIVGMFNILEICKNYNIKKLFYASSSSVYGNQEESKFNIHLNCDKPISLYAATKKSDELLAYVYSNNYSINTIGMRFFTVYGPYGRPDMAYFSFVDKILNGETIHIYNFGEQTRDFTYIDDVVKCIADLINLHTKEQEKNYYKVYNIGRGKPETLLNFINIIEKIVGKTAIKEYCGKQIGDVKNTYADIAELKNSIDYVPSIDLYDGLVEFYSWYKEYKRGEC